MMATQLFGESLDVWARVKSYAQAAGYSTVEEWLGALEAPEETAATVALLTARLKRIRDLAGLTIKEAP